MAQLVCETRKHAFVFKDIVVIVQSKRRAVSYVKNNSRQLLQEMAWNPEIFTIIG